MNFDINNKFKKDDIIEVDIIDYNNDGEGIGKTDAFTWFIKDAVVGDKVKAKALKLKKNYGYAKLIDILVASEERVKAPCYISRQCGGCQLQESSYELQLKFKENKVFSNLKRIGLFEENTYKYEGIIGMEEPFRYRNKAIFPIAYDKTGDIISGFFARRTHNIIRVEDCLIGTKENKEILKIIIEFIKKYNIEIYDEKSNRGIIRNILIRKGFYTNQIMVCVIINANKLKYSEKLVEKLVNIDDVKSICININKENTNVVLGKKTVTIYGKSYIEDYIGDIKFKISALSFFQVNPKQTYKLYSKVLEYAGLSGNEIVWDLYCGIGSISLFLARKSKYVYGIEIVEDAIIDAKENARINKINNAIFYVGKAEELLPKFYENRDLCDENKFKPDVIVVDPPRKGCDKACLDTMIKMNAKKIVYVSCESASLARDLRYLCENAYELKSLCIVDQFPHTTHVETVALIQKI